MNENIIWQYIGDQPRYGKHEHVCHRCGVNYDITGKIIFEGIKGENWEGVHLEFPICTACLFGAAAEAMNQMNEVMLRNEIEQEKRMLELYETLATE